MQGGVKTSCLPCSFSRAQRRTKKHTPYNPNADRNGSGLFDGNDAHVIVKLLFAGKVASVGQ